ncbi:hypothetical protein [Methanosarcina mazei]|uniref:hypothetical protein n=1 Tax=Methanosarcina mazei TaxID=2209 RepID=UPI000A625E62|nr:hypothetical protein [Methanosarcina mazei]
MDISAVKYRVRKEIWHGWGWTPEKLNEYERRKKASWRRLLENNWRHFAFS